MAAGLMSKVAGDSVDVYSAGTAPGSAINVLSAQSLLEVGVDISANTPRAIDPDLLAHMDVVVTLGREATPPVVDGPRYENWDTDEPSERGIDGIERMRLVRDDIAERVTDLHTRLKESSPVSYPGNLTIPTLLIQGMPDTLFPLNQAVANLRMLEAANVTASLYTHLGGHILNTESLAPGTVPGGAGLQGIPGGKPCGELVDLQIAWHQKWLLELPVDTGPRVCISLEDETAVTGETFPLENTTMQAFSFPGPYPIAQAPAGPEIEIPLGAVAEETVVAGIPVLNGTLTSPGADAIVYFSLKVAGRTGLEAIVDDQVVPLRIAGPNTASAPFSVELGGVGVRLMPGDELILVASTVEPMYFGNAERVPGAVVLEGLELLLPVVATAGAAA